MRTRIIEAVVGQSLWTPFLVGQFDHEREHMSPVDGGRLLRRESPDNFVLFDLGTKEGAVFSARGHARADIQHHRIWTSPLFESFLTWVRSQLAQGVELTDMPVLVELPGHEVMDSQRQEGPMQALLRKALASTDKEVQAMALDLWTKTHGVPPAGVPVRLADARRWLGDD